MNSRRWHAGTQILFKESSKLRSWTLSVHQAEAIPLLSAYSCLLHETLDVFVFCASHSVCILCFKYSEVAVTLPFDMLANTGVYLSQHKPSGAVEFQRRYRWDSQQVMTPASFLHLQVCFGRFRSSRRNGKRATIQNLFSTHQHIKRLRRKRLFHLRVCVFSLCSWEFSELVHFLLQHLPGASLHHWRVTNQQNISTALLSPQNGSENVSLWWYQCISGGIVTSFWKHFLKRVSRVVKAERGYDFFPFFPQPVLAFILENQNEDSTNLFCKMRNATTLWLFREV